VRVDAAVGDRVVQANDGSILDVASGHVIPGKWALNFTVGTKRLSLVLHDENVVLILVGVESDLLLLAASGVHVVVRVQVATLGVMVAKANSRTKGNIGSNILHTLGVQGCLELGGHEAIALAGIDQAHEMDGEHSHIESNRDDNQTENTGGEVFEPNTL
jgi:hypothetical protein